VRDDIPLSALDPAAWNALAPQQPLLSHAFLGALHDTGCAAPGTGWRARFLTAWNGTVLVGAMPMYEKTHSYGEYVFDWAWADAYRRHGRRYYPKLVSAIPFTPVPGPRLIAARPEWRAALLARALQDVETAPSGRRFGSLHLLFVGDDDLALCRAAGLAVRRGVQFHWSNRGYRDFADFLAALHRDRRRKIAQDRRKLAANGVAFVRKTGHEIDADDWAFFFRCYTLTYEAHHSTPYLNLAFFERLGATMPEALLLVIGRRGGRPLCAALDVIGPDTLWGRYWGTIEFVSGLHFEACYYQAIEFCIERGLRRFEGGAQGLHKLARGLTAVPTWSAHAIADPEFRAAIADFCRREEADVTETHSELEAANPFRDPGRPLTLGFGEAVEDDEADDHE
jgi:predicted N-acyltransferase